jgi:hypothetical protein
MTPTGTSRGYGSDSDDETPSSASPYEMHETDLVEEDEEHGGGHHVPRDPNWIDPTESTLDDVYITSGGRTVDPAPIGRLPASKILDNMIPPPHAYAVDWGRLILVWFWATLVFTPIFYTLYFGYKDTCYDLGLLLGSWFAPSLDWTTRLIGLGLHFGVSFVFAAIYAYVLTIFRTQSTAGRGVQYGIGIWLAMCTFGLPIFVAVTAIRGPHFDMPDMFLQQSGPANVGYAPLVVALIAHLFYGIILGGLYKNKVLVRQSDTMPALA